MTYPSIEGPGFAFLDAPCLAFEKHDGSNLRFFWDRNRGWHKTGTRYRWFRDVTPMFGPAVGMFANRYAGGIVEVLRRFKEYRGVNELVAFAEYFGPSTFSGLHREDEPKQLVLFDLFLPGRGFVPPRDFAAHFGHLPIPKVVYEGPFSRAFIEDIRAGKYPVNEGIVAKGTRERRKGKGAEVWMAKVKTRAWLEELGRRSGTSEDLREEYERNLREQRSLDQPPGGT
ncbi:MAG: RNA ligase family protein [Isosphaeraceae bacterium]